MSRLQTLKVRAANRGVVVISPGMSGCKKWDVYDTNEGMLGPRGFELNRRSAINMAYRMSLNKNENAIITFTEELE